MSDSDSDSDDALERPIAKRPKIEPKPSVPSDVVEKKEHASPKKAQQSVKQENVKKEVKREIKREQTISPDLPKMISDYIPLLELS